MKQFLIILISLFYLNHLIPQDIESVNLSKNILILKKEFQKRSYLVQPKKYHFLLPNKQTVQFILVKQGRMFSTGIGVASDANNHGYRLSIYELYDPKDYESKELIERFSVTDKIFLREIHDTALYYLIEIEMTGSDSPSGSAIDLVHGFSSIRLKAINKSDDSSTDVESGRCNFGNCGIVNKVDWGKKSFPY